MARFWTPAEAATDLGINPRRVRAWLRNNVSLPADGRWRIDEPTLAALHLSIREPPTKSRASEGGDRRESDEHYVLELCDEVLGELGRRQHTFDWLLGDPGRSGRQARLRVDAYYESAGVVVEYRERQHVEPTPHFDKPHRVTVSGVHRGVQRRMYDERRDRLIPANGLPLWVITPDDVGGDRRGRLSKRDLTRDLELLRRSAPTLR